MDEPNSRSGHQQPTPRAAGIVVVGVTLATVPIIPLHSTALAILIFSTVLALLGLIDDAIHLSLALRLGTQLLAAAGVAGWLTYCLHRPLWSIPVIIIILTGFTNSYNFMDGINGISVITAVTAMTWISLHSVSLPGVPKMALVIGAATLGVGFWNVRGTVFLGDVGSYYLGAMVAGLCSLLWLKGESWNVALSPMVIYIADTAYTLIKRTTSGARIGEAHRDHVYQRLVEYGYAQVGVCLVVTAASTSIMLSAYLVGDSPLLLGTAWGSIILAYLSSPRWMPATWMPATRAIIADEKGVR